MVLAGEFGVKGHDQLRQLFTGYLDMIGDFTLRSTDKFHESEDAIILEATLDTEKTGERKVYDCFVMRDGVVNSVNELAVRRQAQISADDLARRSGSDKFKKRPWRSMAI